MLRRRTLPPPPPPVHLRTWPDRNTLLADRGMALEELRRRILGVHRLLLLWLFALGGVVGWALLTLPIEMIEDRDPMAFIMGPVCAILGLAAFAPSVIGVLLGIRSDRKARELTASWLDLDSHPASDATLRSPGLSLVWLLASLMVCTLGLWASFAATAHAEPGRDSYGDVARGMGTGLILWLTGLVGITKAFGHYRWAMRKLGPTPLTTRHRPSGRASELPGTPSSPPAGRR
ncbi:hypothetical protein ACGFSB_16950 [Streptomyces sp. NPDC048441]|uniref:hypothetical protein n=1 Tax=Streptomyces sp. NPDC048441 TaxID=3365552 RepID=UPI003716843F